MTNRLRIIYDAASKLLVTKGYASTQVSQIAEEASVATGTIYNVFSGKKAILHFVLMSTMDKEYLQRDVTLPIQEIETSLIIRLLTTIAEDLFVKIGKTKDGQIPPFTLMLSILFDYIANYHVAFTIINENREALPDIKAMYGQHVDRLYKVIEKNLIMYIERGEVRNIELPALHIRNIIEELVWWGMYLPYKVPDANIPVSQAKRIALDILSHAYLNNPQ